MLSGRHFQPSGGDFYSHIFENSSEGIAVDVFWAITINFSPIRIQDAECESEASIEWLQWPIRSWRLLDGCAADFRYGENMCESSLYLFSHHPIDSTRIAIRHQEGPEFLVSFNLELEIQDDLGVTIRQPLVIQGSSKLTYTGLLVIPQNVGLTATDDESLKQFAANYVDVSVYGEPQPYGGHGFCFPPRH